MCELLEKVSGVDINQFKMVDDLFNLKGYVVCKDEIKAPYFPALATFENDQKQLVH